MRSEMSTTLAALGAGILIGAIVTLGVCATAVSRRDDAERRDAEEQLKQAQDERDALQARIDDYLEAERARRRQEEQETAATRAELEAAARGPRKAESARQNADAAKAPREVVAAPREVAPGEPGPSAPVPALGPPRTPGEKQ
jgi:hypothetical protein